jgi:hypothetical protein
MHHCLACLARMMLLVQLLAAAASASDSSYVERSSIRRYFTAAQPPAESLAPWDRVALKGAAQLEPRAGGGQAWVLEAATGSVWLLSAAEGASLLQPVTVAGKQLVVPSGSRLLSSAVDTLVVAQPGSVSWLECAATSGACRRSAAAASPAGAVLSAAALGEQLWLGTTTGLAQSGSVGAAPTLLNISGGEPVRAVATAVTGMVAAATAQTLWWADDSSNDTRTWNYLGVGGVIDSNITSLSYFRAAASDALAAAAPPNNDAVAAADGWSLAIGTAHAVHVRDPNGIVARLSGPQGLPVAGITSLHSTGDVGASLWIGTTQGLVEMSSASAASGSNTGSNPAWRYYNGDRWLVSSGADAVCSVAAMAVAPAAGENATVWVATAGGLAQIDLTETTLEQKILHYEQMVTPQHDRYGENTVFKSHLYINAIFLPRQARYKNRENSKTDRFSGWTAQVPLARHGDRDSYVLTDGDNDGSNTGAKNALHFHLFDFSDKPRDNFAKTGSGPAHRKSWWTRRCCRLLHGLADLSLRGDALEGSV